MTEDEFKWGEKSCREIRRKRQESDSGHFVKSLYEKAMIKFKLPFKKKKNINSGTSSCLKKIIEQTKLKQWPEI